MSDIIELELKEAIEPKEWNGIRDEVPEFNPDKQYGMWIAVVCTDLCMRLCDMIVIYNTFIPAEFMNRVKWLIKTPGEAKRITGKHTSKYIIGWKYSPALSQ